MKIKQKKSSLILSKYTSQSKKSIVLYVLYI